MPTEIENLRAENDALKAEKAQQEADETIIREKMVVGLTRDQARQVIAFQRATDEQEKAKAGAEAKTKAAAKSAK